MNRLDLFTVRGFTVIYTEIAPCVSWEWNMDSVIDTYWWLCKDKSS